MTWLVTFLLILGADFEKPNLTIVDSELQFHLPEPLLADTEVERRLLSGLTTSIIIETEARAANGSEFSESVIMEIRYDLWEETLTTALVSKQGQAAQMRYSGGIPELIEALRAKPLKVLTLHQPPPGQMTVRSRLRVIPYSQSEEDAAVTWLGDVLTAPVQSQGQQDRGRRRTTGDSQSGSEIFQVLMSTGLKREAVVDVRWRWRINVGP